MRLETVFKACNQICKNLSDKNPTRGINTDEGRISLIKLSEELDNLRSWCYKGDIEVQKVIRCKNCRYYKRYKKSSNKNPYSHEIVAMCSIDKITRKPEFFCSSGEEREK